MPTPGTPLSHLGRPLQRGDVIQADLANWGGAGTTRIVLETPIPNGAGWNATWIDGAAPPGVDIQTRSVAWSNACNNWDGVVYRDTWDMPVLPASRQNTTPQKEQKAMENKSTEPKSFFSQIGESILSGAKEGAKIGAGAAVANQAAKIVGDGLVKAGMPKELLESPLMQVLLQTGSSTALLGVFQLTPQTRNNKTLMAIASYGQKAAFANVTQHTANKAFEYIGSKAGELMAAGSALLALGEEIENNDLTITQEE